MTEKLDSLEPLDTVPSRLSRIAIVKPAEFSDRSFLYFTDVQDGPLAQIHTLVTAEFFAQYTFQLWNAGQTGRRVLSRSTDVENKGLWLYQGTTSDTPVDLQAQDLVELYNEMISPNNIYREEMIDGVEERVSLALTMPGRFQD